MALNCSIDAIYHTSPEQKRSSLNAARQYKYGSPKIRDVLREKCRIRIKEARSDSFDGTRNVENKSLLGKILRQEVAELEEDIKLQELIYQEMLEEVHEWFIEEYENQENYLIDVVQSEHVFCPVCQKFELESSKDKFKCKCGISFNYYGSLNDFHITIQKYLSQHGNKCDGNLIFFVDPSSDKRFKLNAFCDDCDYYCTF